MHLYLFLQPGCTVVGFSDTNYVIIYTIIYTNYVIIYTTCNLRFGTIKHSTRRTSNTIIPDEIRYAQWPRATIFIASRMNGCGAGVRYDTLEIILFDILLDAADTQDYIWSPSKSTTAARAHVAPRINGAHPITALLTT